MMKITLIKNIKQSLFILLFSGVIFAQNYYVANDGGNTPPYTNWSTAALNINDAVAQVSNGDSVIISNGIYTITEQVIIDKAVTVKSLNGYEKTLIDCDRLCRAFRVTADAVIDGITFSNGNSYVYSGQENKGGAVWLDNYGTIINSAFITNFGYLGGAVYASDDSLISNCVFKYNRASISGGGAIYTYYKNSSTKIMDSYFSYNWCLGWGGGAIAAQDRTEISRCIIHDNRAYGFGGGVYLRDDSSVEDSLIYNNIAVEDNGGGIWAKLVQAGRIPLVSNCIVSNNTAKYIGGGIYLELQGIVKDSIICNNNAEQGGGIGAITSSLHKKHSQIDNCIISGNSAGETGGGYFSAWMGILRNCLIMNNTAGTNGGGATLWWDGQLLNCTIVSNSCENGSDGVYLYNDGTYTASAGIVSNCIIYYNGNQNYENVNDEATFDFTCTTPSFPTGTGNITNAPLFVDMNTNNYKLQADSPCVNKGSNISWMTDAKDLSGNARILDGIVDMGAYEIALALWCDFTADNVVIEPGSQVIFTSNVQGTNTAGIIYDWDFIDAGEGLSQVTNTYFTVGFHDVSLTISNNTSETYTQLKNDYIKVLPEPGVLWIMTVLGALFSKRNTLLRCG